VSVFGLTNVGELIDKNDNTMGPFCIDRDPSGHIQYHAVPPAHGRLQLPVAVSPADPAPDQETSPKADGSFTLSSHGLVTPA
jgi:hypothetical protein